MEGFLLTRMWRRRLGGRTGSTPVSVERTRLLAGSGAVDNGLATGKASKDRHGRRCLPGGCLASIAVGPRSDCTVSMMVALKLRCNGRGRNT